MHSNRTKARAAALLGLACAASVSAARPAGPALPLPRLALRAAPGSTSKIRVRKNKVAPGTLLRAGHAPTHGFRLTLAEKGAPRLPETLTVEVRDLPPGPVALADPGRHELRPVTGEGTFEVPAAWVEGGDDLYLVPLQRPFDEDQLLFEDPADPEPRGQRAVVVMVHGYQDSHSGLPYDPQRNQSWSPLRRHPAFARLREVADPMVFSWRPYRSLPEQGARLAEALVQRFYTGGEPPKLLFLAYSAGALISRHAAADPRLVPHVEGLVTLAGAHRGSVAGAALRAVGRGVRKALGWWKSKLLATTRKAHPITPALVSLGYDDFDGTMPDGIEGLEPNLSLREFNERDPNRHKIIAYAGRNKRLWGRGLLKVEREIHRRVLATFAESWGTADPIVHEASALFEGAPIRARRRFPGRDHGELIQADEALDAAVEDLRWILENPASEGGAASRPVPARAQSRLE